MLRAAGLPALVLFFSMAGFGSMSREAGVPVWVATLSAAAIWGLPGQIAMVEMIAIGAPLVAVALAVAVANARFLPMTLALMPVIRSDRYPAWVYYVLAHGISLNPWAAAMRDCPAMDRRLRVPYFFAFGVVCMVAGTSGVAVGYLWTSDWPRPVTLGLVFLNPAFFAMVFAGVRWRGAILSLILGAGLGPLAHLISPAWGLPIAGLIGGTIGFQVDVWLKRRERMRARQRPQDTSRQNTVEPTGQHPPEPSDGH